MTTATAPQDAPIHWRLRGDLEVQAADDRSGSDWTIKDPLRLMYFHADAEEMSFLKLLNGRATLSDILRTLQQQFPESGFSPDNLRLFLSSAISGGLLSASVPGHSNRLVESLRLRSSQAVVRRLLSLLTYRFRGIDPTRLLNTLDHLFGWIFRTRYLVAGLALCAGALSMVLARRAQFETELPGIVSLFTVTNLPLLVGAVVFIKVLHEIGHGLTCRHYGGECHELGLLFVGFVPLLYCDVSDSWLQQDRRKRMLVSAAGIGTELMLASACAVLWSLSREGVLHSFLLNVMVLSSLNTLLINGNPLLRYDGYYLLSDWLNIPNLAAESRAAAVAVFDRIVLGAPRHLTGLRITLYQSAMTVFGTGSLVYRVLMVTTLLWIVHQTLKPWHLQFVTGLLIVSMATGFVIGAVRGVRSRIQEVSVSLDRQRRATVGFAVLALSLTLLVTVPLPYSVEAPFTMSPGVSIPVFVLEEGGIQSHVSVGDSVQAGDVIAVLENSELESALTRADGELRLAQSRATALSTRRSSSTEAANALPSALKAVQSRESRLASLLLKQKDLTIISPASGTVFPPRNKPRPTAQQSLDSAWFGLPLSNQNRSAWMASQTLLCWIGQADDLRVFCLLTQQDIELIGDNAVVTVTFASMPSSPMTGRVRQRKTIPESAVDRELVANHMVAVSNAATNRPGETLFGVYVALDTNSTETIPPLYSTGYASVSCAPVSLARRAWRFMCHTFTFRS